MDELEVGNSGKLCNTAVFWECPSAKSLQRCYQLRNRCPIAGGYAHYVSLPFADPTQGWLSNLHPLS